MAEIRHRVGVAAAPEEVRAALTTGEGLASWWTQDVRGDAQQGGRLSFYFNREQPGAVMEVSVADDSRVSWRCVEGVSEWVGTTLEFELRPGEGETVLLFTHGDWAEPSEFMHHCSTKWGYFLLGLKGLLEGRPASPHPHDVKISAWG